MHKLFIRVIIKLQLIGAGHSRGSPKLLACCYIIFGKGNSNLAFEWGYLSFNCFTILFDIVLSYSETWGFLWSLVLQSSSIYSEAFLSTLQISHISPYLCGCIFDISFCMCLMSNRRLANRQSPQNIDILSGSCLLTQRVQMANSQKITSYYP